MQASSGKTPRTPTETAPTTADEALLGAADGLRVTRGRPAWSRFTAITTEFDMLLNAVRQANGTAPIDMPGPARLDVEDTYDMWRRARDDLQGDDTE